LVLRRTGYRHAPPPEYQIGDQSHGANNLNQVYPANRERRYDLSLLTFYEQLIWENAEKEMVKRFYPGRLLHNMLWYVNLEYLYVDISS
jgi:hypothetical protein